MTRDQRQAVVQSLFQLTEMAEQFVNHTPRLKRTEGDRQALLDVITQAQLVLSVHRLPAQGETPSQMPKGQPQERQ